MSTKAFENNRWISRAQPRVFRHTETLQLLSGCETVLDLGCGDGLLLKDLKEAGIRAHGADLTDEGVRICKKNGLSAETLDFADAKLPFDDKAFDAVTLLDVLEHLHFPESVLQEAARVARKYVIVSVPNFNSLPARIQVLLGKVPENNGPSYGHVYWFNLLVLKKMLADLDLEIDVFSHNTFWQDKPIIKYIVKVCAKLWPSLFALSFVIRTSKVSA